MAKADSIQTNFTGGELSPALALGRVDIAKYNNGAKTIENCTLTVQGGAKRRPGSRFIAFEDNSTGVRLIDFVFNRTQAYVVAMVGKIGLGQGELHFYKNRARIEVAGSPVNVRMPYTAADLPTVNFVQKADTTFFAHEGYFPQRLQRFSDLQWGMGAVPFITAAYEEQGHTPAANLTLTQTGPTTWNVQADTNIFLRSDVGRTLSYGGGFGRIYDYGFPDLVAIELATPFPAGTIPSGQWLLGGSPQDGVAPSGKGKTGESISLSANYTYFETAISIDAVVTGPGSIACRTVSAHGYTTGDTVQLTIGSGVVGIFVVQVIDSTHFAVPTNEQPGLLSTSGSVSRVQISAGTALWRAQDVGSIVTLNDGMVQITQVQSDSVALAKVLRPLNSDVPVGANAWVLMQPAWNASKGYPRAVTINQQRLWYGGSPGFPQHLWASEIGGYLSFQWGTADDQAFRYELDGPRNSPIRHLAPSRFLLVLTDSDEMSVKGGQEKPVTPTNFQKTDESTAGAAAPRPVKVGNEILFVQAAGKKLCAAGYRYDIDGVLSPDRTVMASHIAGAGFTQIAHQKEPDSTLYAIRQDGQLAVCAYDVEQDVIGWARWITQGQYTSVCVVPTQNAEDVYTAVNRTLWQAIPGQFVVRRCIEVMDPTMYVDCGVAATDPVGRTTWGGLGHLEKMTVQAWADGAYLGEYVVNGGEITLPRAAKSVQIGLGFNAKIEMLQPQQAAGASQVSVNEVVIRVLDTQAAVINGQDIEFRRFGEDLLDQPPPVFSGEVRGLVLQDAIYKTSIVIEQPYPLPFHLLNVIRRVTANEG